MNVETPKINAKDKILKAALTVIRTRGYSATTVDDLCHEAGVTKGAFFHHFKSKEDLAVHAAHYWSEVTGKLFAHADYHHHPDPLDRVLGYIDFRKHLVRGSVPEFTCFVGTMVQEAYDSNPAIREACQKSIFNHASTLTSDMAAAKKLYASKSSFTPESLAIHTQTVIQGAFILAKAQNDLSVTVESIDHLRHYVELLFNRPLTASHKIKENR